MGEDRGWSSQQKGWQLGLACSCKLAVCNDSMAGHWWLHTGHEVCLAGTSSRPSMRTLDPPLAQPSLVYSAGRCWATARCWASCARRARSGERMGRERGWSIGRRALLLPPLLLLLLLDVDATQHTATCAVFFSLFRLALGTPLILLPVSASVRTGTTRRTARRTRLLTC